MISTWDGRQDATGLTSKVDSAQGMAQRPHIGPKLQHVLRPTPGDRGDEPEILHAIQWRPRACPYPEFTLRDAAATIRSFRAEGKPVLLHCVRMESPTPTVAAFYGALVTGLLQRRHWNAFGQCFQT
jgi:hypothetical protein